MAERIVSPGVFTRERDLSFLPQGVSQIGAAIVGPTLKGPSFVPTVVRNFEEFRTIFGGYTTDYYTPYAVKEYLNSPGSVTIVRVGHLGGYKVSGFNLVAAKTDQSGGSLVVASFLPGKANSNGGGSVSGSLGWAGSEPAANFEIFLNGANATASLATLSILPNTKAPPSDTEAKFITAIPSEPGGYIGSTASPVYMYKHFRSSISESYAREEFHLSSSLSIENHTDGYDFSTGGDSVNSTSYLTTNTGNSDASSARTPYIQSMSGSAANLFRVYMRADGTETNNHYIVISNIKQPADNNSSPGWAEFSLSLHGINGNDIEAYNKLNLDPDSPNYIVRVIGDQFHSVDNNGEVTTYGDYTNLSPNIRIGDYDAELFKANKTYQPMGFAAVIDPIKSTASVPTGSLNFNQYSKNTRYIGSVDGPEKWDSSVPYGWKAGDKFYYDWELYTNKEYHSPIPYGETAGSNIDFNLGDCYGFGDADSLQGYVNTATGPNGDLVNFTEADSLLTISSSASQLKYAVPFQHGFDGVNPSKPVYTDGDITAANVMGYDCSSATASGSVAYKRAISAVSNPDEIDINMLVTPGIIHKLHSGVTNHAIDKVESRADCFYIMDGSAWADNVATAVNNVKTLDTNYVATYYPWVKIAAPSGNQVWVPPSVVLPGVISYTDSVAHEWFAPAGLNRGGLSSVTNTKKKLTHTDRDTLYDGRVNPIASFPGQGVVVFGQKTLQAKPSALDRINVRRLLIKLKKFIASSSRFLVFEQNDSSTRSRFLNIVNPFLESVQSNSGLSAFKVVMDDSNNTPDVIDRNQLVGQIFIQPTRTAEFIVLDFTVLPTGAAFPE